MEIEMNKPTEQANSGTHTEISGPGGLNARII